MSDSAEKNLVFKQASLMGLGVLLSRVLGLVREQVFAILFGATSAMDAYTIAFRIPNLLRDLFAEGALSQALIPTLARARKEGGDERAFQLATKVMILLFGITSLLSIIAYFFSEPLVHTYASAYQAVPGKFELTVALTQILLPFFPLVSVAAAVMALLNTFGAFFIPAFSSALFNFVSLTTGVFLATFFHSIGLAHAIYGMAIGVVLGGVAQLGGQLPTLMKKGYRFKVGKGPFLNDVLLKRIFLLMLPGMLGLAATQLSVFINSILATGSEEGAVSWLAYAFRLMQFPIGILGVSLAQATLTRASKFAAENLYGDFLALAHESLVQVISINLMAAAVLAGFSEGIISLLFQHGKFNANDTLQTAHALQGYALGLASYSAVKVLVPMGYALGATRISVMISFLSVAVSTLLSVWLLPHFSFVALPVATSVASILSFFVLKKLLLKRVEQKMSANEQPSKINAAMLVKALALAVTVYALLRLEWTLTQTPQNFFEFSILRQNFLLKLAHTTIVFIFSSVFIFQVAKILSLEPILKFFELFLTRVRKKLNTR